MSCSTLPACDLCGALALQQTKQYRGCWSENCVCMDEGASGCKAGPQMAMATLCRKCCVRGESYDDDPLFGWRMLGCWSEVYFLDDRIAGPSFQKCLKQITPAQEGARVLVGTAKVPGTIVADHRDGVISDVKVGEETLTLHAHDYDMAWGDQLTVGFVNGNLYENRCCECRAPMGSCGSQYCGKTECLREDDDEDDECGVRCVPIVVAEFCTGTVKTQFVKSVGHVQYLHVQKTTLPQLQNCKVTFAQVGISYGVRAEAIVHPTLEMQWSTLLCARHLPCLPQNIWRTIFWVSATTFNPEEGVGHPVLLDGAFGEEYEKGFSPFISDDEEEDNDTAEVVEDVVVALVEGAIGAGNRFKRQKLKK